MVKYNKDIFRSYSIFNTSDHTNSQLMIHELDKSLSVALQMPTMVIWIQINRTIHKILHIVVKARLWKELYHCRSILENGRHHLPMYSLNDVLFTSIKEKLEVVVFP